MRTWALVATLVLLASCSNPGAGPSGAQTPSPSTSPTPEASPSPSPTSEQAEAVFLPDPDRRIARRPPVLARNLTRVAGALRSSIDEWPRKASGTESPRAVILQALFQQRIYRLLARRADLMRAVSKRVAPRLRRAVAANATAGARLRSLVTAVPPSTKFRIQRPQTAGHLFRYYEKAERRFGVAWEVLAAVNQIETKYGRVRSPSSAGAQGPMQFLPSTWDAYGLGGDIHDPHDAILGAANYLHASGAPGDYRQALYAYNHADAYVDAVLLYARQMRRDPDNYFAYYNWQVFVITTKGDVQLTGPGRDRPRR